MRAPQVGEQIPGFNVERLDSSRTPMEVTKDLTVPLPIACIQVLRKVLEEEGNRSYYDSIVKYADVENVLAKLQGRNLLKCSHTGMSIGSNDPPAEFNQDVGAFKRGAGVAVTAPVVDPAALVGNVTPDDLLADPNPAEVSISIDLTTNPVDPMADIAANVNIGALPDDADPLAM